MDKKGTGQEDPDKRNNTAMPEMGILLLSLIISLFGYLTWNTMLTITFAKFPHISSGMRVLLVKQ